MTRPLPPDIADANRIVIKIGSALLVGADGGLNTVWLSSLAQDVARLKSRGADVIIVSSGAIALGRHVLPLTAGVLPLEEAQAAAAIGQIRLARAYQECLVPHGLQTAQILLTLDDAENRGRYLNTRATLGTLLAHGVIPIVNENDTIATDEIRYGDNDRLAANVAAMAGADMLILLSDVDGFYTADPRQDPKAHHIPLIRDISAKIESMAGDAGTSLSRGGMKTKIMAAQIATAAGCVMAIAAGAVHHPLQAIEQGARVTWFAAVDDPRLARKRWIAAMKPKGAVVVDDGAVAALQRGKSLLPAGVTRVFGAFGRGDAIALEDKTGHRLGLGLSRYAADEAEKIAGHHSDRIEALLGYPGRTALIHRDDMALLRDTRSHLE